MNESGWHETKIYAMTMQLIKSRMAIAHRWKSWFDIVAFFCDEAIDEAFEMIFLAWIFENGKPDMVRKKFIQNAVFWGLFFGVLKCWNLLEFEIF